MSGVQARCGLLMNLQGKAIANPGQHWGLQPRSLGLHHTYHTLTCCVLQKNYRPFAIIFFLPRGRGGPEVQEVSPLVQRPPSLCPPSPLYDRQGLY